MTTNKSTVPRARTYYEIMADSEGNPEPIESQTEQQRTFDAMFGADANSREPIPIPEQSTVDDGLGLFGIESKEPEPKPKQEPICITNVGELAAGLEFLKAHLENGELDEAESQSLAIRTVLQDMPESDRANAINAIRFTSKNVDSGYAIATALNIPMPARDGEQEIIGGVPALPDQTQLSLEQLMLASTAGRWLDDYISFASEASPLTPHTFHEAAGLSAGALAIAKRLHWPVSIKANFIYPNLYLLFIGHSTRPRKTTALRVYRGLIHEAGMDHFLLADRTTPEALQLSLSTKVPVWYDEQDEEYQRFWTKQRPIAAKRGWLLEEASHLLDSFNRDYSAGLLPLVLDLYDCADIGGTRETITRGPEQVEDPYINIFGATTYGAMSKHAREDAHWRNGLWARFALVGSDNSGVWRYWPPKMDYPRSLVKRLRFIAFTLLPMPEAYVETIEVGDDPEKSKKIKVVKIEPEFVSYPVEFSQDARDQCERYAKAVTWDMIPEKERAVPGRFYANYGKLGTIHVKVSMVLATFDTDKLPVRVEAKHTYRAQLIVERWRANLHGILAKLAELAITEDAELILSALAESGREWMTRRDLLRKIRKTWSSIKETIDDLDEVGEIEREEYKPPKGRMSEKYRIALDD